MTTAELWQASLDHAGLEDAVPSLLSELESLYSERHRSYHNLQHVLDCLRYLALYPIPDSDTASLDLAIWFHDAIYKPLEGGNELASADLAVDRLASLGLTAAQQQKVHRLIMATTHDSVREDLDESVMIDVDLSILGRDRPTFEVYESSIRREYRLVPGPLYRHKRKAILQSFLSRPHIYSTEVFRDQFEDAAESNLRWAISKL